MTRWIDVIRCRLRSIFRRDAVEHDLDRELRLHLDQRVSDLIAEGHGADEARFMALREFGSVASIAERCSRWWHSTASSRLPSAGARPRSVFGWRSERRSEGSWGLVVRDGAIVVGGAILVGLAVGLVATKPLAAFLVAGLETGDPATFAGTALLLDVTSFVACWGPARRATRIEPSLSLRAE